MTTQDKRSTVNRAATQDESADDRPSHRLHAGDLSIDCEHRSARIDGREVPLAPNEVTLLQCLLEARGRVVPRPLLLERLTGPGRLRQPKMQSVDVHIKRLRQKLGPAGRSIITVRNAGYRFDVCREWISSDLPGENPPTR